MSSEIEIDARLTVYEHLFQVSNDIKLGRVQDLDEAFEEVLSELEDTILRGPMNCFL